MDHLRTYNYQITLEGWKIFHLSLVLKKFRENRLRIHWSGCGCKATFIIFFYLFFFRSLKKKGPPKGSKSLPCIDRYFLFFFGQQTAHCRWIRRAGIGRARAKGASRKSYRTKKARRLIIGLASASQSDNNRVQNALQIKKRLAGRIIQSNNSATAAGQLALFFILLSCIVNESKPIERRKLLYRRPPCAATQD